MKATLEVQVTPGPGQYSSGAWLYLPGRMLRVWASLDTSYGSHWGLWRTSIPGDQLSGWNWRGGPRRLPLTILIHTRKLAE